MESFKFLICCGVVQPLKSGKHVSPDWNHPLTCALRTNAYKPMIYFHPYQFGCRNAGHPLEFSLDSFCILCSYKRHEQMVQVLFPVVSLEAQEEWASMVRQSTSPSKQKAEMIVGDRRIRILNLNTFQRLIVLPTARTYTIHSHLEERNAVFV